MYVRFHHPPPTSSDRTHRHTRTSKYPLPRIPSSELHGNHSLTPITMATGIGITHAFFTDQFPLCLMCVSLYVSLSVSPAPSLSFSIHMCPYSTYFPERRSAKTQQPADTIFVTEKAGAVQWWAGGCSAACGASADPQAKCSWEAYWSLKATKSLWSVLLTTKWSIITCLSFSYSGCKCLS